ncbi:MAG TPA: hypothetical protein VGR62_26215 [Candidatus Binatia bacterium]|jgi:hypothetical protein|nr:hypothetical protein [Candidatus Binatia bacterium]
MRTNRTMILGAALLAATVVTAQAGETVEQHETYEKRSMKVETIPPPPPVVDKKTTTETETHRSNTANAGGVNESYRQTEQRVETHTPPPTAPPQVRERTVETETIEKDD